MGKFFNYIKNQFIKSVKQESEKEVNITSNERAKHGDDLDFKSNSNLSQDNVNFEKSNYNEVTKQPNNFEIMLVTDHLKNITQSNNSIEAVENLLKEDKTESEIIYLGYNEKLNSIIHYPAKIYKFEYLIGAESSNIKNAGEGAINKNSHLKNDEKLPVGFTEDNLVKFNKYFNKRFKALNYDNQLYDLEYKKIIKIINKQKENATIKEKETKYPLQVIKSQKSLEENNDYLLVLAENENLESNLCESSNTSSSNNGYSYINIVRTDGLEKNPNNNSLQKDQDKTDLLDEIKDEIDYGYNIDSVMEKIAISTENEASELSDYDLNTITSDLESDEFFDFKEETMNPPYENNWGDLDDLADIEINEDEEEDQDEIISISYEDLFKNKDEENSTSNKKIFAGEEFDKEKSYLKDTKLKIQRIWMRDLEKEFNHNTDDANIKLWKSWINRGNEAKVEMGEAKKTEWMENQYDKWKNKPYQDSLLILNNEDPSDDSVTRYYIGERDVIWGSEQYIYSQYSDIGDLFTQFHSTHASEAEEFSDIVQERNYSIREGELIYIRNSFNKGSQENQVYDQYLVELIEKSRNNADYYDIFSTIRKTQSDIVLSPISDSSIIEGCAGSGKTILIFYRISRAKYKNKELPLDSVYLITPTDLLNAYNAQIIAQKNLNGLLQANPQKFLTEALKMYYSDLEISIPENSKLSLSRFFTNAEDIKTIFSKEFYAIFSNQFNIYMEDRGDILENLLLQKQIALQSRLYLNRFNFRTLKEIESVIGNLEESKKERQSLSSENIDAMRKKHLVQLRKYSENEFEKAERILSLLYRYYPYSMEDNEKFQKDIINKKKDSNKDIPILYTTLIDSIKKIDIPQLMEDEDHIAAENLLEVLKASNSKLLTISLFQITAMMESLNTVKRKIESVHQKLDYLDFIENEMGVGSETAMVHNKIAESMDSRLAKTLNLIKMFQLDKNYHSFSQYIEAIDVLKNEIDLLSYFINTDMSNQKIFLLSKLALNITLHNELGLYINESFINYTIRDYHEICMYVGLMQKMKGPLKKSPITNERFESDTYYLFFDEVQDLSYLEIECIKGVFPSTISHYLGDHLQCINPKGLQTEEEFYQLKDYTVKNSFKLEQNYRNANEITQFVNEQCDLNMIPIGLKGNVEEIDGLYCFQINPKFKNISLDRVAIIVKDKNEYLNYLDQFYLDNVEVFDGNFNNFGKDKTKIFIYSVEDVKGLEFDIAAVDTNGMTRNEKYIACTRAMKELYFVAEKNDPYEMDEWSFEKDY